MIISSPLYKMYYMQVAGEICCLIKLVIDVNFQMNLLTSLSLPLAISKYLYM